MRIVGWLVVAASLLHIGEEYVRDKVVLYAQPGASLSRRSRA
ncbi:MAG TPA: hypothetical protein VG276_16920 [Actinomycetes bacterium]|nr:hypothetical protein [Actinomycetes bacterium]